MLTQNHLKSLLDYAPDTGAFTWRVSRGKATRGAVAGSLSHDGYMRICIDRNMYLAHRLAFLYVNGKFPKDCIDHINGNKADNRISNLREASPAENSQNIKCYMTNTSGFTGVYFNKRHNKFYARINYSGKRKHLGHFDTAELASEAYKEAKQAFHTFNPEVPLRGEKAGAA